MYQVGYDPLTSAVLGPAGSPLEYSAANAGQSPAPAGRDCVLPSYGQPVGPLCGDTPPNPAGGFSSGFSNFFSGLFSWLTNAMNSLAGSTLAGGTGAAPEQSFQSAGVSSLGDPHLSVNGTTTSGQTVDGRWDSMAAHADLLSSDSFAGGLQVSNAVTSPSASGVTLNSSVTIATNNGNTQVSLDGSGNATISNFGLQTAMQAGQQYALGNGEVVTDNANGSVSISDANGQGGTFTATLSRNGAGGVDFSAGAKNVDLGGYLVSKTDDAGVIGSGASSAAAAPIEDPVAPFTYTPTPSAYQPQVYQPQQYQAAAAQGMQQVGDLSAFAEDDAAAA